MVVGDRYGLYICEWFPAKGKTSILQKVPGKSLIIPYDIPIDNYEFKIIDALHSVPWIYTKAVPH